MNCFILRRAIALLYCIYKYYWESKTRVNIWRIFFCCCRINLIKKDFLCFMQALLSLSVLLATFFSTDTILNFSSSLRSSSCSSRFVIKALSLLALSDNVDDVADVWESYKIQILSEKEDGEEVWLHAIYCKTEYTHIHCIRCHKLGIYLGSENFISNFKRISFFRFLIWELLKLKWIYGNFLKFFGDYWMLNSFAKFYNIKKKLELFLLRDRSLIPPPRRLLPAAPTPPVIKFFPGKKIQYEAE